LSVIAITPLIVPVAVGVNCTAILQVAPGANAPPQVVCGASIVNCGLLDVILLIVTDTSSVVFFTVMNLSALVVLTGRDAKVVLLGEIDNVAMPVPESGIL
jgi:hypothetical protein